MDELQQSKILFVEQDRQYLAGIRAQLDRDFELYSAETSEQALEMIQESGPFEAVITDTDTRGLACRDLLERIEQLSPATVRILLTAEQGLAEARAALDEGRIYRYLLKTSSCEELKSTIAEAVLANTRSLRRKQLEQETEDLLATGDRFRSAQMFDPELGIGTPEAMEVEMEYMHNTAVRYKRRYSIAIFDLDYLQSYESHYGRRAAKLAHKLTAEHIRHSCRSADRIYRYNAGTAILLILPETPREGGKILAQRIVRGFAARNIPNSKSEHSLLTLSGSVASYDPEQSAENGGRKSWSDLLDEVQLYLHVAQGQGGNCVSTSLPYADEVS